MNTNPRIPEEPVMEHELHLRDGDIEPDDTSVAGHQVADSATGAIRLCAEMCATCIFRPGNPMHLEPGRVADMVEETRRREGHIVCHDTLGTSQPAICRGYADGPDKGVSLALRLARALGTLKEVPPPRSRSKP